MKMLVGIVIGVGLHWANPPLFVWALVAYVPFITTYKESPC